MGPKPAPPSNLKYLSLVTLTLQNAILGLSMRYAQTRPGAMFVSSTAVVMAELVKLCTSLVLVFFEEDRNFLRFKATLYNTIIKQWRDTLKICVPSFLYILQNNLLYTSAKHLDAATYQVTYQLKILTTAVFAVIILRKKLLPTQWAALLALVVGVASVQLSNTDSSGTAASKQQSMPGELAQDRLIGFSAALGACFLSGFAGIYFEKMLKGADISIWMRNIQLSVLSLPFGMATCYSKDGAKLTEMGFFYGYDGFIWYLILLQAGGGLIVAVVVKYADNILKGFATSLAIIISCVASMYLFDFQLTVQFTFGAALVIASIFLYGYDPSNAAKQKIIKLNPDVDDRMLADKV